MSIYDVIYTTTHRDVTLTSTVVWGVTLRSPNGATLLWPVASPGFGVRGARRSRRRRREHRGAKGTQWGEVWGGVSAPQPTRGSGGALWAPPAGSGAEPRPLSHFLHILGHRTPLVARTIRFSCPKYKFHFQKVVVTSHHRHIQSCAYAVTSVMWNAAVSATDGGRLLWSHRQHRDLQNVFFLNFVMAKLLNRTVFAKISVKESSFCQDSFKMYL